MSVSSGTNHTVSNNVFFGNPNGIIINGGHNWTFQMNSILESNKTIQLIGGGSYEPTNILFNKNIFTSSSTNANDFIIAHTTTQNLNKFSNNNFINCLPRLIKNTERGNLGFDNNFVKLPIGVNTLNDIIIDQNTNIAYGLVVITNNQSQAITSNPLFAPLNITKSTNGTNVVISWSNSQSRNIAGYKVYYGGYTGYSFTNVVDVGNTTTYTLPAGVNISDDIAVTAYDASKDGVDDQFDGNESWYSPANKVPDLPANLTADSAARIVKLNWTASVSAGVNNYNIYRSTDAVNFTKIGSSITTNYTDQSLTPATRYFYKVAAFDSLDLSYDNYGLESSLTAAVSATPNKILYVSTAGNNVNIGSYANPRLTIANAIDYATAGDSILLFRGTYKETIDLKGKISFLSSLFINTNDTADISNTILSGINNGNNTLISNSGPYLSNNYHIYALTIKDVRLAIVNLSSGHNSYIFKLSKSVIKNSGTYGQWGVIDVGNNGILDSCTIFDNKGRYIINVGRVAGAIISNNTLFNNSSSLDGSVIDDASVIHLEGKGRVLNNLIFRNRTTGIDFGGNGSDSMIFINNTVVLNQGYGIRFQTWSGVYSGILINNLSKFNKSFDISCNTATNGPGIFLKNNFFGNSGSLYGTGLSSVNNTILDTSGNIGGDPYFVDTLNNNFKLRGNSSAIGAGTAHTYPLAKDLIGNNRINTWRTKPDIGVYESDFKFPSATLTKTEPSDKFNSLFWTQTPTTGIKGYKIFRSTSTIPDNGTPTLVTTITSSSILTYVDADVNLVNGTTYYYRIKSIYTDDSESGFGNELTAIPNVVAIPSNFKIDNGPAKGKLTWDAIALTGVKYRLFKSINVNVKTLLVDSLNATTYTDVFAARNTVYYYWIRSMNTNGTFSDYSQVIQSAPTNIWYVDSAIGVDLAATGSITKPYKKISTAVANTITADTVLIGNGTYLDNIVLTNKTVNFIGINGAGKVVLKPLLQSVSIFSITNAGSTLFKGISFANVTSGNPGAALSLNRSNPTIEACIFRNNSGLLGVISNDAGTFTMNNCIAYGNTSNKFFNFSTSITSPALVNHLTFNNNSGNFLNTSISGNVANFKNSILWNSNSLVYTGTISVENSIFKGGFSGSTSNIDASPMFADSTNNDFHLLNFSPAIGFGSVISGVTKDFDGNNRALPSGSSPDAGAYESIYDHPAPYITSHSSRNGYVLLKMTQTPVGTVNKFNVYKGLTAAPTLKYRDTTLVSSYLDSTNSVFNKVMYYRFTSIGASNLESGYSNEIRTIAFTPPALNFPLNQASKSDTNINFQWGKIDNATLYKLQFSTDSNFVNGVTEVSKTDTFNLKNNLVDNTTYFWRAQTLDSVHYSKWSNFKRFQTFVRKPVLTTISSLNRYLTINWTINSSRNIKAFKIYKGTATNPTTKIDSISVSNLTYSDSVINGTKYYYRVTAINTDNVESDYSNELFANAFDKTILDSPSNNKVKEILQPTFKWQAVADVTKYQIQITTVATLAIINVLDTVTALNSLLYTKGLADNTTFYWRVRNGDAKGYSSWTSINTFQTYVLAPTIISIIPSNKRDTINWTVSNSTNIKYFKIFRDTISNPTTLIDSINGSLRKYIDTTGLSINKKYYYRLVTGNNQSIESEFSNTLNATPFNTLPKVVALGNREFKNVGEFNFVRTNYSTQGSSDIDGKIVGIKWYVNDSLVNASDSVLVYYYNQGTNKLKLVIADNDGGKDSSTANITLSSFVKTFKGGFLGGITALSPNIIYTADSTFDPVNGASISIIDRAGNSIYPLVVSSKIFTTPSVSSDSSVFITNGSSLNGFNKSGAPLWPTIPLGGLSYVTPTIDSLWSRIYVGVSNKNFFAIDYKTGKVDWNLISDAPINASAIITGDRKLVYISQVGTLYGFDIRKKVLQTAPKWKSTLGEIVTKSPAVDGSNNLIIGTESGKVLKVKLNDDGTTTTVWSVNVNASIQSSAVIDANGFIYVGNSVGDFYKLNPNNGATVWKHSTGAAIKSTPSISEFGNIYVANVNGVITALNASKSVKWTYQADGAISANMLYIKNMLYVGTESGKFLAIYDNPYTNTVNTGLSININKNKLKTFRTGSLASVHNFNIDEKNQYYYDQFVKGQFNFDMLYDAPVAKEPVWGTFQGNYRRTGSKPFECPEVPVVNVPNCIETADSIKVSTNDLINKLWVVNDVVLYAVKDTAIYVKPTDKYKLLAYNSNGCDVYSTATALIPNSSISKPKITTNSGLTKFCDGDSIILNSTITATHYQWNYSSLRIADASNKNLVTTLQGAYSVTVINEFGCKSTSDIALILSTPKPNVAAINGVNAVCLGNTTKLTNATAGGVWSSATNSIAKIDASGNITTAAAGTTNIGYTVTAANGCSNMVSYNFKVNALPAAPVVNNVSLCVGGTSGALTANALGGHSLLWYESNATGGTASTNAPTPNTTTAGTTNYYVSQIITATGCESPRAAISVTVNAIPAAPTIVRDGTNNLVSSALTGNLWYKEAVALSDTGQQYKPTTAGNYSVKTTLNGCTSSMSAAYYYLVTALVTFSNNQYLKLYPNPARENFRMDYKLDGQFQLRLKIYDLNGKLLLTKGKLSTGSLISLKQLSPGAYVVIIEENNGKLIYIDKIIKE